MDISDHNNPPRVYHSRYEAIQPANEDGYQSQAMLKNYSPVTVHHRVTEEALSSDYDEPKGIYDDHGGSGPQEEPKAVLETRFDKTLISYEFFVHMIAVGATAAVVQLTFRGVYWTDDTTWKPRWYFLNLNMTDLMNVLQFGAKLHEIFIVASLSMIIMNLVRRQLVGRGVALGLLAGAYQVGSAEYFFSPSFLSPFAKSMHRKDWRTFSLALVIGASIIYANMVGPASAIALLPNLDWWPVATPFNGQPFQTILVANRDDVFPMNLVDPGWGCESSLNNNTDVAAFTCPAGGHESLLNWAISVFNENSGYEISMVEPLGKTRRLLSANTTTDSTATKGSGSAIATTHTSSLTLLMGLFWHYVDSTKTGFAGQASRPRFGLKDDDLALAPLVQDQCITYDYETLRQNPSAQVLLPYDNLRLFGSENGTRRSLTVPRKYWDYDVKLSQESTNLTWLYPTDLQLDSSAGTSPYRGSIAAILMLPSFIPTKLDKDGNVLAGDKGNYVVACIMDARWASTQASFDAKNDDLISTNLTDFTNFNFLTRKPTDATADDADSLGISKTVIQMPKAWIGAVDVPVVLSYSAPRNTTSVASLFYPFIVEYVYNSTKTTSSAAWTFFPPQLNGTNTDAVARLPIVSETVATVLSMAITDAISRSYYLWMDILVNLGPAKADPVHNVTLVDLTLQAGAGVLPPGDMGWADLQSTIADEGLLTYNMTVDRYGWGYGFKTRTVQFGIATVLIHCAVVAVYLVYIFSFRIFFRGYISAAWADLGDALVFALMSRPSRAMRNTGAGIEQWDTWMFRVKARERDGDAAEMVVERTARRERPVYGDEYTEVRLQKDKKYR